MRLDLKQSYGLKTDQLAQIQALERVCNQFEGLTMKLNWGTLKERPRDQRNDFFGYADGQLVGYLALYGFNQREVEISAMTHPAYRRRGIFKALLAQARAELKKRRVAEMLFICERMSGAGTACMAALAARYEFSEFKMRWQGPVTSNADPSALQIRLAQPEDITALVRLDERCFGVAKEAAQHWLSQDLVNPQRRIWLARLGPVTIGKINVWATETEMYIAGFCVWPEYRGQGYGKILLTHVLNQLLAERSPQVVLEVACGNEHALSLYQQCGFDTVTAYDYYRLPV